MRALVWIAAAALAGACAVTGGSVTVNLHTINSGAYAGASEASAIAAMDEESYRRTWTSKVGAGEIPTVDFRTHVVVFLFAGTRPTGGYAIDVRGATIEGRTLVVDAVVEGPPAGSMVTQALTSPYAVIAVDPRDFDDVRWSP